MAVEFTWASLIVESIVGRNFNGKTLGVRWRLNSSAKYSTDATPHTVAYFNFWLIFKNEQNSLMKIEKPNWTLVMCVSPCWVNWPKNIIRIVASLCGCRFSLVKTLVEMSLALGRSRPLIDRLTLLLPAHPAAGDGIINENSTHTHTNETLNLFCCWRLPSKTNFLLVVVVASKGFVVKVWNLIYKRTVSVWGGGWQGLYDPLINSWRCTEWRMSQVVADAIWTSVLWAPLIGARPLPLLAQTSTA